MTTSELTMIREGWQHGDPLGRRDARKDIMALLAEIDGLQLFMERKIQGVNSECSRLQAALEDIAKVLSRTFPGYEEFMKRRESCGK